jgi:hypothetical protein
MLHELAAHHGTHAVGNRDRREDSCEEVEGPARRQGPCRTGRRHHFGRRRLSRRPGGDQGIASLERCGDREGRGRASGGISRETAQDRPLDLGRDVGNDARGAGRRRLESRAEDLGAGAARVCGTAREHLVEDEPERVEVALHGHLAPHGLLVGQVGRRPGREIGSGHLTGSDREAEIGEPRPASPVEHHVVRLEIAVQDAPRVGRHGRAPPRCDSAGRGRHRTTAARE